MLTELPSSGLVTREQAAEYLGLRPQTLSVWAMTGRNLPYVKLGHRVRYKLADLDRFISDRTCEATS
jgi:excisionase family DNA binding protein